MRCVLLCFITITLAITTLTHSAALILPGDQEQICGGFAGVPCPSGYSCQYPEPYYPDAQGVCKKNNEPPRPPLLLSPPNTSQTIVAIDPRQPAVELRWQDNGDPDGDPVAFWITITQEDSKNQRWDYVFTDWAQGVSFTFTSQQGLAGNACYAWQVFAIDPSQRSKPSSTASDWAVFCTTTMPELQLPKGLEGPGPKPVPDPAGHPLGIHCPPGTTWMQGQCVTIQPLPFPPATPSGK